MTDRVLHFAARWLPVSEGFVYDLVTNLSHPGLVVASRPLENMDRFDGPEVHTLERLRRLCPGPLERRAVTADLLVLMARNRVRLVHAHHGYDSGLLVGALRRRQVPLVISLHGDDVTGLVERSPRIYAPLVGLTRAVIVPSVFLGDFAVRAGFDPALLRVIPSGIDTSFFAPRPLPEGRTVLFVGRFVEKKGLDVLASAWPTVLDKVPDARLRIFGFGPLEPLARSMAGDVEVVLSPTRAAVRDAMYGARCIVSPSHTAPGDGVESLLVVNVEAQACGRPVVTTRHGGIPEHVDAGHSALLVPEADPPALADALVQVLLDDVLAQSMAAAGPPFAARYDLARTARQVDDLYDELLP